MGECVELTIETLREKLKAVEAERDQLIVRVRGLVRACNVADEYLPDRATSAQKILANAVDAQIYPKARDEEGRDDAD